MSNMTTIDILSVQQKERLHELEATIDIGIKTFVEVGKALAEIQDNKLYLEKYTTFEAYSEARFGLKRATAYQYIAAAEVAADLAEVSDQKPTISQTRPLVGMNSEDRKKAWKEVCDEAKANGQPITERQVKEKVSAIADNGAGLGMGKIHKITPRVAAEPVPSLPETEEIAELRQRPTQLEYQILQGELETTKQAIAKYAEAELTRVANNQPRPHRYLTGTILEEVIADMCYYGKTYTDKSRLIADVGNEMRNRNITAMTTNMISFVNDFLKKQNYPRFDIAEDGSLEYRKEEAKEIMHEFISMGHLKTLISKHFEVSVQEDDNTLDLEIFKRKNNNTYCYFGRKNVKENLISYPFRIHFFTSDAKPNDLSADYLHHAIHMRVQNNSELLIILSSIQ